MELRNISTKELISELSNRPGVKKLAVGLYQPYELIKKYTNKRDVTEADCVLAVYTNAN